MPKKAKRRRRAPSELAALRIFVQQNTDALEALKRESATHLRRCAELQMELDALKKRLAQAILLQPHGK
jgi:regulator of replication initiation timing